MAQAVLQAAERLRGLGLDGWEVYLLEAQGLSFGAKDGSLETITRHRETGLAVRVMLGRRTGAAYAYDLSSDGLAETIQRAVDLARVSEPDPDLDPAALLAGQPAALPEVATVDPDLAQVTQEAKAQAALRLERAALDFDRRVVKCRRASYTESRGRVWLVNSAGLNLEREGTSAELDLAVLASQDGESQMGYEFDFDRRFGRLDPEACGRRAAVMAVDRLGAGKSPTGRVPVVLDNTTAALLLSVLTPAFLAENVRKGKSLLAGKVGQEVFSPALTVIDDGLRPWGAGTRPFDDEGTPQRITSLVTAGRVTGLLYDRAEAARAGVEPTGHGRKAGLKAPAAGGPTNLHLQPGQGSLDDLCAQVPAGLLVTELMGLHTADPISGDFSLGAVGFRLEGGRRVEPIQGAAISGNLVDLFQRLAQVGADLRFVGATGAPSLLFDRLDVAG